MMTHITIKIKEVMMIIDIPPPANPAVGTERHTITYNYATTPCAYLAYAKVQCLTLQFISMGSQLEV